MISHNINIPNINFVLFSLPLFSVKSLLSNHTSLHTNTYNRKTVKDKGDKWETNSVEQRKTDKTKCSEPSVTQIWEWHCHCEHNTHIKQCWNRSQKCTETSWTLNCTKDLSKQMTIIWNNLTLLLVFSFLKKSAKLWKHEHYLLFPFLFFGFLLFFFWFFLFFSRFGPSPSLSISEKGCCIFTPSWVSLDMHTSSNTEEFSCKFPAAPLYLNCVSPT